MTIIKRVVDALRASGHGAEADELQQTIANLGSTFNQLDALNKRKDATVRELVFTMQSRCRHFEWYLVSTNVESNPATWGPEDVIACFECGHTVCDEKAWAFGRRVMQGHSFMNSRTNPRLFGLDPSMRKHLGDKLIVKEIEIDAHQEALRVACHSAGKGATPRSDAGAASVNGDTAGATASTG